MGIRELVVIGCALVLGLTLPTPATADTDDAYDAYDLAVEVLDLAARSETRARREGGFQLRAAAEPGRDSFRLRMDYRRNRVATTIRIRGASWTLLRIGETTYMSPHRMGRRIRNLLGSRPKFIRLRGFVVLSGGAGPLWTQGAEDLSDWAGLLVGPPSEVTSVVKRLDPATGLTHYRAATDRLSRGPTEVELVFCGESLVRFGAPDQPDEQLLVSYGPQTVTVPRPGAVVGSGRLQAAVAYATARKLLPRVARSIAAGVNRTVRAKPWSDPVLLIHRAVMHVNGRGMDTVLLRRGGRLVLDNRFGRVERTIIWDAGRYRVRVVRR